MKTFAVLLFIGFAPIIGGGTMREGGEPLLIIGFLTVGAALYLIPSFVAHERGTRNRNGVTIVNIFLGWMLIPWVVALAMAVSGETQREREELLAAVRKP